MEIDCLCQAILILSSDFNALRRIKDVEYRSVCCLFEHIVAFACPHRSPKLSICIFPSHANQSGQPKSQSVGKSVDGIRLLRRGIADDCHIRLGEITMIRTCYAPKRHSV